MSTISTLSLAALAAAVSACAIQEARIPLSPGLAGGTETLEVRGLGGGKSGSFTLAGASGTFARGADRLGIMDPTFVRHSGGGRFALAESPVAPALAGRCSYREGQVNLGSVSVTPRRFGYQCDFVRGSAAAPAGRMAIHDRNAPAGSIAGLAEREGMLDYSGQRLVVRSIHRSAGGSLPLSAPLGYAFVADGREVGAVDLNGTRKTVYAPTGGPYREAVIAGALALSILWDPADVQPDF